MTSLVVRGDGQRGKRTYTCAAWSSRCGSRTSPPRVGGRPLQVHVRIGLPPRRRARTSRCRAKDDLSPRRRSARLPSAARRPRPRASPVNSSQLPAGRRRRWRAGWGRLVRHGHSHAPGGVRRSAAADPGGHHADRRGPAAPAAGPRAWHRRGRGRWRDARATAAAAACRCTGLCARSRPATATSAR